MALKEIDALGDWADGLVSQHGLSSQLTFIWLEQHGITKPRRLTQPELADLKSWAFV